MTKLCNIVEWESQKAAENLDVKVSVQKIVKRHFITTF